MPLDANGGSWLRRRPGSVLNSVGVAHSPEAFPSVEASLPIGKPLQPIRPSPRAKAPAEAVAAAVPPLSTILLSNLIKGTLVHVRAKVMNEQGAAGLGEYWANRWALVPELRGRPGG
jgi:hypothetical protein